jgi:hypothetical protein
VGVLLLYRPTFGLLRLPVRVLLFEEGLLLFCCCCLTHHMLGSVVHVKCSPVSVHLHCSIWHHCGLCRGWRSYIQSFRTPIDLNPRWLWCFDYPTHYILSNHPRGISNQTETYPGLDKVLGYCNQKGSLVETSSKNYSDI